MEPSYPLVEEVMRRRRMQQLSLINRGFLYHAPGWRRCLYLISPPEGAAGPPAIVVGVSGSEEEGVKEEKGGEKGGRSPTNEIEWSRSLDSFIAKTRFLLARRNLGGREEGRVS
jgi:hypothetical protein